MFKFALEHNNMCVLSFYVYHWKLLEANAPVPVGVMVILLLHPGYLQWSVKDI